jgi:uncharacterized membrane protein YeaQ/YmgE (transglycosylase-associated protein family)
MIDDVMAWAAIGAAASLVAMAHPFRRGAAGIALNLAAGVAGAVVGGFIGALAMPGAFPHARPWQLFFSALGAMAGLFLTHAVHVRPRLSKAG